MLQRTYILPRDVPRFPGLCLRPLVTGCRFQEKIADGYTQRPQVYRGIKWKAGHVLLETDHLTLILLDEGP